MKPFNRLQIYMFTISLIAILLVPIWIIIIVPNLTDLPNSYISNPSYFGELKAFEPEKGALKQVISINRKIIEKSKKARKNNLFIKRIDTITNSLTQEVLLQEETEFIINKKTRKYININQGNFFTFPKNTQKKDYDNIIYPVLPRAKTSQLKFSHEENLFGMATFVFRYKKENFPLEEDAKKTLIFNSDIQNQKIITNWWGKIWVEPKTGMIVRQENNWGHYIVNPNNQQKTNKRKIIESGRIWQQDEEIKRLIQLAQSKKAMYQIYEMWIPIYLLLFAFAFAIGSFLKESSPLKID